MRDTSLNLTCIDHTQKKQFGQDILQFVLQGNFSFWFGDFFWILN